MANRRVLVKRRKSVRNIRKITRTMQLIATARFQAAFNRAVATRPYTEKLAELVADLSRAAGDVDHPLLKTNEGVDRAALVVLTSDRGLAGGYNASVLRTATAHLDELPPATVRVRLFQAFNDAAVSEQVARMVAMKAATDAAQDMIKALTREYNRARQTQITMELLDIVGGANALS